MTPQEALEIAKGHVSHWHSGDMEFRPVLHWTREYEDAFMFSFRACDPGTDVPCRFQPGGGGPILVSKADGSRRMIGMSDDLVYEYGLSDPPEIHSIVVSASSDRLQLAKVLRDGFGLTLPEALAAVRAVEGGVPFEREVPSREMGEAATEALRMAGAEAVHRTVRAFEPKPLVGRPWPVPDDMPRLHDMVRRHRLHIGRYLDGEIDAWAFMTGFHDMRREFDDAEDFAFEDAAAVRREWNEMLHAVSDGLEPIKIQEEIAGNDVPPDPLSADDEAAMRGDLAVAAFALDAFAERHGLSEENRSLRPVSSSKRE